MQLISHCGRAEAVVLSPAERSLVLLLHAIRARPAAFLLRESLDLLATHLYAYCQGRGDASSMAALALSRQFTAFLARHHDLPEWCLKDEPHGWVRVIGFLADHEKRGYDRFWCEWDRFLGGPCDKETYP